MTDLQYALMKKVMDNVPFNEDLISGDESVILESCRRARYVHITQNGNIVITAIGKTAILEHEYLLRQEAQQQSNETTKDKQSKTESRIQFLIDFAVSIASWFFGK